MLQSQLVMRKWDTLKVITGSIDNVWDRFVDRLSNACKDNVPVYKSKPKHYPFSLVKTRSSKLGVFSFLYLVGCFIYWKRNESLTTSRNLEDMYGPIWCILVIYIKGTLKAYQIESQETEFIEFIQAGIKLKVGPIYWFHVFIEAHCVRESYTIIFFQWLEPVAHPILLKRLSALVYITESCALFTVTYSVV
jgi:hypothetical protein